MDSFSCAIALITSTEDIVENSDQIHSCIDEILERTVNVGLQLDLICFPENALFLRLDKNSHPRFLKLEEIASSSLQERVEELSVPIMITTGLEENGIHFNATVLLRAGQHPKVLYRKKNLFDVDVPGAPPVRESDLFKNGNANFIYEQKGWKFGLSICFDLRFSNMFYEYARDKVDAILVPSAFLVPTGEAHWHTLLRARAIESQCYVLAPAQGGEHKMGHLVRHTFGHSLAVDPWGRVLADLEKSPQVAIIELKREELDKVRGQIPMKR